MYSTRKNHLIAFVSICLFAQLSNAARGTSPESELRVVTFNIRYGTAADGENHWNLRKDFLIETINAMKPDLLGTQETLGFQRDYLAKQLADYDYLGVGRDDGKEAGEMMALYYRRARFELLESGHFWLSESPEVVGSKSWDSSLPRMTTWVKLKDRHQENSPPILFLNTHFDHRGPIARLESARLIRKQVEQTGKGCLTVLTGDFNTDQKTAPYEAIFGAVDGQQSPLVDAYRTAHPQPEPNEGTFSGFKAAQSGGTRIDWIGVSPSWKIVSASTDRTSREGRTPSDHFPVLAVLSY